MSDKTWTKYQGADGQAVESWRVDTPGDFPVPGVAASVGQYIVRERKESKGVALDSVYIVDAPDPQWHEFGDGVADALEPNDPDSPPSEVEGELGSLTEQDLINLAGHYEVDGTAGMPMKAGLIDAIQGARDGEPGAALVAKDRAAMAAAEARMGGPESSNADPSPRSSDSEAFTGPPVDLATEPFEEPDEVEPIAPIVFEPTPVVQPPVVVEPTPVAEPVIEHH